MTAAPIIVISGLPGVGKSTTARELGRRFDRAAHVEADRLQDLIVSGAVQPDAAGAAKPDAAGVGAAARRQLDLRLKNAALLAGSFATAGFTAIVDDIVIGDAVDDLDRLLDGRDFHFVMLLPDFAHVKQRWIDMGSPFAEAWDWIDDVIRNETTRRGLWLDTTSLDVHQTADAIIDHMANGTEP